MIDETLNNIKNILIPDAQMRRFAAFVESLSNSNETFEEVIFPAEHFWAFLFI